VATGSLRSFDTLTSQYPTLAAFCGAMDTLDAIVQPDLLREPAHFALKDNLPFTEDLQIFSMPGYNQANEIDGSCPFWAYMFTRKVDFDSGNALNEHLKNV